MEFNPANRVVMTCTRAQRILQFQYKAHDVTLQRVTTIRDHGALLSSTLDFGEFREYCQQVNPGTYQLNMSHWFSVTIMRVLYTALGRPVLENSCIVKSLYHEVFVFLSFAFLLTRGLPSVSTRGQNLINLK